MGYEFQPSRRTCPSFVPGAGDGARALTWRPALGPQHILLGLALLQLHAGALAQWGQPGGFQVEDQGWHLGTKLLSFFIGGLVGGLIGAFFSDRLRKFRTWVLLTLLALFVLIGVLASSFTAALVGVIAGGIAAYLFLRDPESPPSPGRRDTTLGSAEWATLDYLRTYGLLDSDSPASSAAGAGPSSYPSSAPAAPTATAPINAGTATVSGNGAAGVGTPPSAATTSGSAPSSSSPPPAAPMSARGTPAERSAGGGIFLGLFRVGREAYPLHYRGDRHLLTIAPTRSGKGVSAIVPNLLTYAGSALVIDPKGENALITATRRGAGSSGIPGLGQAVHVVDPWGITGLPVACFNPLDWLGTDADNATENAMILAESVVPRRDGKGDPFWDEEARSLLVGLLLHVSRHPAEEGNRTLRRVREIVVAGEEDLARTFAAMIQGDDQVAASTASRTVSKEEKLRSNVLASLQSHTHFLDSPAVAKSLSRSDFQFQDLKTTAMTVYLVLPADRLDAFGRWLRLLVQQAITVNARNIQQKPKQPIIFILDELAALGRLSMVEQAFGLMAGFGMQLWGVVQDTSQLKRIYDDGWETFIGNAGVIQYFGSRDHRTAEYFSKLCGVTTVEKVSLSNSITQLVKGDASSSTSTTRDVVQRQLAYPDELMVLKSDDELVFVENLNPIRAIKLRWFDDPKRRNLGRSLHR
jgi:type IV secretion system protein VirD4